MDEEGYIKIVGRIKDMIIRGGENIYPSEIESTILQHSHALDAQVIAVADERLGEVPAAYVRLNESAKSLSHEQILKDLKSHCSTKLAKYKVPEYWKIVESYPATLSGKVKKFEMRNASKKDFDLA